MKTVLTSPGDTPARSRAALMAVAPSLGAGTAASVPRNAPMGVRAAPTMTTSCTLRSWAMTLLWRWGSEGIHNPVRAVKPQIGGTAGDHRAHRRGDGGGARPHPAAALDDRALRAVHRPRPGRDRVSLRDPLRRPVRPSRGNAFAPGRRAGGFPRLLAGRKDELAARSPCALVRGSPREPRPARYAHRWRSRHSAPLAVLDRALLRPVAS